MASALFSHSRAYRRYLVVVHERDDNDKLIMLKTHQGAVQLGYVIFFFSDISKETAHAVSMHAYPARALEKSQPLPPPTLGLVNFMLGNKNGPEWYVTRRRKKKKKKEDEA